LILEPVRLLTSVMPPYRVDHGGRTYVMRFAIYSEEQDER